MVFDLQAIDGLYCVGDSCFPGQGVIAVAFSGIMCAHRVAADLGKQILDRKGLRYSHIGNNHLIQLLESIVHFYLKKKQKEKKGGKYNASRILSSVEKQEYQIYLKCFGSCAFHFLACPYLQNSDYQFKGLL